MTEAELFNTHCGLLHQLGGTYHGPENMRWFWETPFHQQASDSEWLTMQMAGTMITH